MKRRRHERGIVLVMVLFFALLLVSSLATFLHRATVDTMGVRSRDAAQRAEALARGGVRLAIALLLEDRVLEGQLGFAAEGDQDVWAQVSGEEMELGDGATLTLSIADAGTRLNLNALFDEEGPLKETEIFLKELLQKVVDEMPVRPEEKNYDVDALVQNLIDWVDSDDVRQRGGLEDEYYQGQTPAYRAPNLGHLLSVEELRLVEGFDGQLVDALAPYVGIHPVAGGEGINPNTAETWVLALLFHGGAGEKALASADDVADLDDARGEGLLCGDGGPLEHCLPIREVTEIDPNTVFPAPTYQSDVFHVRALAQIGAIRRQLEVVVDRSDLLEPRLLAWQMR
ncbi:MAG: type II secretion system minor pseudopilin GspK [Myxococcota bacterium]